MSFTEYLITDAIQYNIDNDLPLTECVFRRESDTFYQYFNYLKTAAIHFEGLDKDLVESDIGSFGIFESVEVPLDLPFITEEKDVELNSPKRNQDSGKKYYVYVKNDKGNVIKINFGDKKGGLTAKINNDEARKSFVARHKCSEKKDKTTAGYWSCRLPYYSKQLGLSGGGEFWW